jgi:hypothetical protein
MGRKGSVYGEVKVYICNFFQKTWKEITWGTLDMNERILTMHCQEMVCDYMKTWTGFIWFRRVW